MRILMLGNSLTTANGLPGLLSDCLDAEVVVHARGGARLAEHLNPATKLGARTAAAFAGGHWRFEHADPAWRSLHYVAGGRFYATGEALDVPGVSLEE